MPILFYFIFSLSYPPCYTLTSAGKFGDGVRDVLLLLFLPEVGRRLSEPGVPVLLGSGGWRGWRSGRPTIEGACVVLVLGLAGLWGFGCFGDVRGLLRHKCRRTALRGLPSPRLVLVVRVVLFVLATQALGFLDKRLLFVVAKDPAKKNKRKVKHC